MPPLTIWGFEKPKLFLGKDGDALLRLLLGEDVKEGDTVGTGDYVEIDETEPYKNEPEDSA